MCLAAFSLLQSERYPFVLASNRDEFFERPTATMHWWQDTHPAVLAGRDLGAHGTWLGLTDNGRLALLTNIRNPKAHRDEAATRGTLVPGWLSGQASFDEFWASHDPTRYNGFNLVALDFSQADFAYASSAHPQPRKLKSGLYGLSNAELDTPWPKVQALKQAVEHAAHTATQTSDLIEPLLAALADTRQAPDDQLPSTGVSLAAERALSAAHVHLPARHYGTRCSTLVICERLPGGLKTTVLERSFHPGEHSPNESQTQAVFTLPDWPGPGLLHPVSP
jgi:uncharacterized protein with NRDE domain